MKAWIGIGRNSEVPSPTRPEKKGASCFLAGGDSDVGLPLCDENEFLPDKATEGDTDPLHQGHDFRRFF